MIQNNKTFIEGIKIIHDLDRGIIDHNLSTDPVDFHRIVLDGIKRIRILEGTYKKSSSISTLNKSSNILLLDDGDKKTTAVPVKKIEETPQKDIWEIIDDLKTSDTDKKSEDKSQKNKRLMHCVLCGPEGKLIENQNSLVCSKCGVLNEEYFDSGPEWRQYNNDDSRSDGVGRCGCPTNPFFPKSSQGTIIVGVGSGLLKRKQKWNHVHYKEKSLNTVFDMIDTVCRTNMISKIISDTSKTIYNKINECKHPKGSNAGKNIIIRGNNRLSIIGACIHRACEINKEPRTIRELARYISVTEKQLTRGIKQLDKLLKICDEQQLIAEQIEGSSPEDYIRRHWKKLKLTKDDMDLVFKIINNCCRLKLVSNHNPQSISAGSILLMAEYNGLNIDRKRIAELFGTSDVTIGKTYNKIAPFGDALIDNDATDHLINKFGINNEDR